MIKKPVIIAIGFLSLFAQLGRASDTLSFFKNYFVTGDAAVAGVGRESAALPPAPSI